MGAERAADRGGSAVLQVEQRGPPRSLVGGVYDSDGMSLYYKSFDGCFASVDLESQCFRHVPNK